MIRQLSELRGFGYLFRNFLSRDLSSRYKGSLLGVAWSLMNPLVMMGIYTVVFSVIFPQKEPDYAILLLAAYLPFFFFQSAVSFGVPTLIANAGLIKKVYFPRELLPLSMTSAGFVNFLLTMALLLPAAAYAREGVNGWALLTLIPVSLSFLLATAGLVMLLSALNVYFRDVEFLSGIVLTVLFYLTPVVYTLAFVRDRSREVELWIGRNPLTPFTEAFRTAIYYREVPATLQLGECAFIGIGGFVIGYTVFNRLKGRLAEELWNDTAITVDGVTKSFRIYRRRETTLKETILRGRRGEWEDLRAADDLSFTVPRGQALGVIGPNGAGKSTLLKLLARILTPDRGRIAIDGRVSALLELGAGFHPEYSAIENIFLSGAFYGMSRAQLKPRVDSIIEFAELGRFADNPVKTYSSGMYARLGFAIAVSVEPDVLLCDEVLAVGDESFRQRCYDRMLEFRDAGRTLVLVTHDLGAVHQFCNRAIWMQRGSIQRDGDPREVVRAYIREVNAGDEAASELSSAARPGAAGTHTPLNSGVPIVLHALRVRADDGAERGIFENGETLRIEVDFVARNPVRSPICEVEIHRHDGTHVATGSTYAAGYETGDVLEGHGRFVWRLEDLRLTPGVYYLSPQLRDHSGVHVLDRHERWVRMQVREGRYLEHDGCVVLPGSWELERAYSGEAL